MACLTNYAENKILDWLMRGQSFTPPSTWYGGLLSAAPSDSSSGTELSGDGYARVAIQANLASWYGTQGGGSILVSSGTSGTTSNVDDLVFGPPEEDWGEAAYFGLYDAASGGNLFMYCTLAEAKHIYNNDVVLIPQASLVFQIDN